MKNSGTTFKSNILLVVNKVNKIEEVKGRNFHATGRQSLG